MNLACLYLDMNIYNRPFDDQSQMRIRLETVAITIIVALIEQGYFSACWSFMLAYENSRNPVPERRAFVRYLANICDSTIMPDESIRALARQLSEQYKVLARDALHLACAESHGCDYLVTCDDRFTQGGKHLNEEGGLTVKVINPVDLLRQV